MSSWTESETPLTRLSAEEARVLRTSAFAAAFQLHLARYVTVERLRDLNWNAPANDQIIQWSLRALNGDLTMVQTDFSVPLDMYMQAAQELLKVRADTASTPLAIKKANDALDAQLDMFRGVCEAKVAEPLLRKAYMTYARSVAIVARRPAGFDLSDNTIVQSAMLEARNLDGPAK